MKLISREIYKCGNKTVKRERITLVTEDKQVLETALWINRRDYHIERRENDCVILEDKQF